MLDCKITLAAETESNLCILHPELQYFLTCEDYYHEAADYMTKILDCHEIHEPHPAAHNISGLDLRYVIS